MLFNSFVKIDGDIMGTGADNYTGQTVRIIGKYPFSNPLTDNLYQIYFENGERRNFFIWQFSVVNFQDYSLLYHIPFGYGIFFTNYNTI